MESLKTEDLPAKERLNFDRLKCKFMSYEGEWKNGVPHGGGVEYMEEEDIYKGEFVNGFKEGNGVIRFKNGNTFTGDFKCNLIDGFGEVIRRIYRR